MDPRSFCSLVVWMVSSTVNRHARTSSAVLSDCAVSWLEIRLSSVIYLVSTLVLYEPLP